MDQIIEKYLQFGKYTGDCPQHLLKKVTKVQFSKFSEEVICKIFKVIRREFDPRLHQVKVIKNFAQSRFISANDVFKKRQFSCGSLATVVASIFRTLDIPTKLIDGKFIKDNPNMKHAWNEIYVSSKNEFIPFDITKPNFRISNYHIKERELVDWVELESFGHFNLF